MPRAIGWGKLLLLILAVVLTSWQALTMIKKKPNKVTTNKYHADSFGDHVVTKNFDNKGFLIKQLSAKKLIHYPSEDTFFLKFPEITLNKNNETSWRITAREGISKHNNAEIELREDVHIVQLPKLNKPITQIITESLTYFPKKHLAQTDSPITLQQPGITLKAQGIKINFMTQAINLLSHAQGTYLPQEAPLLLNKKIKDTLNTLHHA